MGREDETRLIAYNIWEEQNCPEGRDCEHWFQSEAIWEERNKEVTGNSTSIDFKQPINEKANFKTAKKKSRKN